MQMKWMVGHGEHETVGNDGQMFNHTLTLAVDTTRKLTEDEWRLVESRATLAVATTLQEIATMDGEDIYAV